jgi:TRAP-type mannitol/chloroaromatic compound transport system substrate-binding protein
MHMLGYESLTTGEQEMLSTLVRHPAYGILKKLMEEACVKSTARVIQLKVTEDNYASKLQALQQEAQAMNEFSAAIIKSIEAHSEAVKRQLEQRTEELEASTSELLDAKHFGSIRIKKPKIAEVL